MAEHEANLDLIASADPFAAAAERAADLVQKIAAERGRARVAFTGGSAYVTAPDMARHLRERGFDFGKLHVTWIDERCVPSSSPESNRRATRFEPGPGVELPLFLDGEDPGEAAARVQRGLEDEFDGALDVVLLGIGPDGHIASLFVGRPALPGLAAYVSDSPKPPPDRITLTRTMLATASHTLLAVRGESKRAALERVLAKDPALPVVGLPGLVVFTDLETEPGQ